MSKRRWLFASSWLALAACQPDEPENIQVKAEKAAGVLENRAEQIAAEAENGTGAMVDALDNQTDALANQAGALANAADNVTINME